MRNSLSLLQRSWDFMAITPWVLMLRVADCSRDCHICQAGLRKHICSRKCTLLQERFQDGVQSGRCCKPLVSSHSSFPWHLQLGRLSLWSRIWRFDPAVYSAFLTKSSCSPSATLPKCVYPLLVIHSPICMSDYRGRIGHDFGVSVHVCIWGLLLRQACRGAFTYFLNQRNRNIS